MVSINFTQSRWRKLAGDSQAWWAGTLERPMVSATLYGREPGRAAPRLGGNLLEAIYDLSVSADDIVDAWDYGLCCQEFLGDAFPTVWPYFGPVSNTAFFGARPQVRAAEGTVWYHADDQRQIADLHFADDPVNPWLMRTVEVYRAAAARWGNAVCIGDVGLATGLDILSTFRPAEKLLLDLYDHPRDVSRCVDEIRNVFWEHWRRFDKILSPRWGYTGWIPLFCTEPFAALQCDFAYMISPRMFRQFVAGDLAEICRGFARSIYHLDGVGQLAHLDDLLAIPELSAVQWVPGDGRPGLEHWPEVYRRIRSAGKSIQLYGGIDVLRKVADQLGSAKGLWLLTGGSVAGEDDFRKALERYGAV